MKAAIVYDRVNKWGGAERVLLALHEIFPDAPLFTSVYNPETAPWASVFSRVIPSPLQKIPFAKNWHEGFSWLMPIAFESFNFDEYDLVVSVTSESAKGIITKPKTLHICYCLTPTRYLWSGYDNYFPKGSLKRFLSQPLVSYLRTWDKIASERPDKTIAISNTVRARIKKYYNLDSSLVYPPVELGKPSTGKEDFYLVVSRLVPYKRVDLAVKAFNSLGLPLVIVGSGSEESKLKSISKSNIKFVGQLTDSKLSGYYKNCRALIFPQEEDFGIVALEAQSLGKPVIAFKKGGALETVIDGKTGIFFEKQDKESLIRAVKKVQKMKFNSNDSIENAKRFTKKKFKEEFLKACMS